jgi:phage terminase large subunit
MFIDFSDKSLYNNKYIPIMHNKKRYVLLMWWGGSGKSTFQAQNEIIKTFSWNRRLLCIRKVKDTCKDSVFSELTGVIEEWGLSQYFDITRSPLSIKNKLTWSDILFRGIDDPEKIKSIRRVSRVWIEEATELDREDFNQIDLRLRWQTDMQIICTFNPIDQEHWLNLDLWQHWSTDNVECLHTTFLDNRWVWVEYRDVMERLRIQDPRMYEIYALGKWGSRVEWIIFDKWTEIDTVPEWARELWYGLDFWYTNDPTALINWFISDNAIILDEVLYRTKMTNWDIINIFKSEEIDSRDDILR